MPIIRYRDELEALLPLAERQAGFVSAVQAIKEGVDHSALARLVEGGHLERFIPGIYRFARWPLAPHADLWPIVLWTQGKWPEATLSHRTALLLHGVSDINPASVDVTVPYNARFRGTTPSGTVLYPRRLQPIDTTTIDGLPVTTLYRTLLDLIVDRIASDAVEQVLTSESPAVPLTADDIERLRAAHRLGDRERQFIAENLTGIAVKAKTLRAMRSTRQARHE